MTWREAFALLQIEAEMKIGREQREAVRKFNAGQDAAADGLRAMAQGE